MLAPETLVSATVSVRRRLPKLTAVAAMPVQLSSVLVSKALPVHDCAVTGKTRARVAPQSAEQVVGIAKQFEMDDDAGILGRPDSIPLRFPETVSKEVGSEWVEVFVEAPHLGSPFGDERFWADNEHIVEALSGLKFLQNQARFDCLPETNLVGQQRAS